MHCPLQRVQNQLVKALLSSLGLFVGYPMFSCPGDFLFGFEYVDKVFLENGSQEKSDTWEGISFKCTGVAGNKENEENPLH